jgi:hypothetical protein
MYRSGVDGAIGATAVVPFASGARKGTLAALIGGDTAAYELAKPIISCFSDKQTHLGAAGSGHLVKAINNVRSQGVRAARCGRIAVDGRRCSRHISWSHRRRSAASRRKALICKRRVASYLVQHTARLRR